MAMEKTQTPKNDVFATQQELVLEGLNFAAKQREELEKLGRDGLERSGVLVRATCQTALDAYDFGVRMMSTYQNLTEEMVRTSMGMARKATARAA
jgi:hypothetical protein